MYMIILEAQVITPVSTKNTITLPHEIMIALGLHPRDRVLLELANGQVMLRRAVRVNLVGLYQRGKYNVLIALDCQKGTK
jgi:bifunctional DNA-binding transcriptional regulator/antitoxin component of YhaV-PrlF toxin-antitoxin module